MAGHGTKLRRLVGMGAGTGLLLAAAAMATGSAAPVKADFDDLLDPILQPLISSFTESITALDPAAATDVSSLLDSLGLGSFDSLTSSATEPAAAVAAADSPVTGTYDIPLTVKEDTEPTVQATIDGGSNTLLVDTGSSGLVIPWQALDSSNPFQALEDLFQLGFPTGISESGYSGGVEYIYLTYNDVPTDYGDGVLDTTGPVDIEVLSWPTSFSSPLDFQQFLQDDDVTGILGIGDSSSAAGPTESPLQTLGYGGVLVDIPGKELVVEPTAPGGGVTVDGAPISQLYESVDGGTRTELYDDVDSGGVYGTIPSSLVGNAGSLPSGATIDVYDGANGPLLYSYTTGTDSLDQSTAPTVESGIGTSSSPIDSGVEPFLQEPIYLDYGNDTMTFYPK